MQAGCSGGWSMRIGANRRFGSVSTMTTKPSEAQIAVPTANGVAVPSNASPLAQLGVEITTNGTYNGTIYVDSVNY